MQINTEHYYNRNICFLEMFINYDRLFECLMLSKVHMHFHIAQLLGNSLQSHSLSARGQFVYLTSNFPFAKMDGINC